MNPYAAAAGAAEAVAGLTGAERHDVAVVLGSGWGDAAAELGDIVWEGPLDDVPGMARPTVGGHRGASSRSIAADAACWCSPAGRTCTKGIRSTPSCTACAPRCSPGAAS